MRLLDSRLSQTGDRNDVPTKERTTTGISNSLLAVRLARTWMRHLYERGRQRCPTDTGGNQS